MSANYDDAEIRAYILAAKEQTFPAIAASIAARFGDERAWPAELVAAVFRELRPPNKRARFERDAELMAFIADRADIATRDDLRADAIAAFGPARVPSRSHFHRLIVKVREVTARAAVRAARDQPKRP